MSLLIFFVWLIQLSATWKRLWRWTCATCGQKNTRSLQYFVFYRIRQNRSGHMTTKTTPPPAAPTCENNQKSLTLVHGHPVPNRWLSPAAHPRRTSSPRDLCAAHTIWTGQEEKTKNYHTHTHSFIHIWRINTFAHSHIKTGICMLLIRIQSDSMSVIRKFHFANQSQYGLLVSVSSEERDDEAAPYQNWRGGGGGTDERTDVVHHLQQHHLNN